MRVSLYDHVGTGLIIKAKTGIVWTNQTGGVSCLQPECEGLFVPFGNDSTPAGQLISFENILYEFFREQVGATSFERGGWAQWFERALASYAAEHCCSLATIELDHARLAESFEAWVHVIYRPTPELPALVDGLGEPPFEAVLTWTNSD